jgi:2,4-dienoyl-CoA reductase (NADPH2)
MEGKMEKYELLFSPFKIKNIELANRITMAPMFVGYANPDGTVNSLVLNHYKKMGCSGAALIVVENVCIDATGLGSPFMMRIDDERYIEGLKMVADVIHSGGALAFLQINHAGRYAYAKDRIAPSPAAFGQTMPREMTTDEIHHIVDAYAKAALRAKRAGFDGVELHGGTGYLLAQFLSPRLNKRNDSYGGSLEKRMHFPLEVIDAVKRSVEDYPVGYRLLADELLPGGFGMDDAISFAKELSKKDIDYISVMIGTHESYNITPYVEIEKTEGYMALYAKTIKEAVPGIPIITAGRIQTPECAEKILNEGSADLIGLARVLYADSLWPKKARGIITEPIVPCNPNCSLCMDRILQGKRPFCSQWSKEEKQAYRDE